MENKINIIDEVCFGVLMCNFNRAEYLKEAVESVFSQTHKNWKLYILDDGSTDHSIEIINHYRGEKQIIVLQNIINKGVGYSKQLLIENSIESIVGFLDSDDALAPTALEECILAHQKNPLASIVYTNHWICNNKLQKLRKGTSREIPKGESHATYYGISLFASFKRKHLNQINGIRKHLTKAADQDLYLQLEEVGSTIFIPKCLYFYRHNDKSISLHANSQEAGIIRLELLREAAKRRKSTTIPYPSEKLLAFRKRQITSTSNFRSLFMISDKDHFIEVINYFFYLIKVNLKKL